MPSDARPTADPLWVGRALGRREIVLTAEHLHRQRVAIGVAEDGLHAPARSAERAICPASVLFYEPMEFSGPREHDRGRAAFNAGIHWQMQGVLRVGERILLEARVADRWLKRGREYAMFEMTARDATGRQVAVGGFKESWDRAPAYLPPLQDRHGVGAGWHEEPQGGEIGYFECSYSDEMSIAYAGPVRNLHTDAELARQRGFDGLVIAGPQLVALVSELMTRLFGLEFLESGELKVNLLCPVFAGDTITARATLLDRNATVSSPRPLRVAVACVNQHGAIVAGGSAAVGVLRVESSSPEGVE